MAAGRRTPAAVSPLLAEYLTQLQGKAAGTLDAYQRVLCQFLEWLAERPGRTDGFAPDQFTATAVETYLEHLAAGDYRASHRGASQGGPERLCALVDRGAGPAAAQSGARGGRAGAGAAGAAGA
jgi:hypothetical protein